MKRLLLNLVLISCLAPNSNSQPTSMEFGIIGQNDINITSYPADPQAEALVLFDIGDSRFIDTEQGYDILFTRTRRIKILTSAGIKYSEVSIPIYNDKLRTEIVKSIEAFSYNIYNGKIETIPFNEKLVYTEKINNNWSVKKFALPDVRPGSIIEYKYVLQSPFHFNLPDWEFQSRIPTVYSKYCVRMIPFYEYAFIVQGITRFDSQESRKDPQKRKWGSVASVYGQSVGSGIEFNDMIHTYVMKNVPAFKDESYITSISDYLIKMDFQLAKFHSPTGSHEDIISTWPLLIDGLLKDEEFGKYMNSCERLAKNILEEELQVTGLSPAEKCRMIINYAKTKFSWDGFSGISVSKSARDFFNQKKGNIAEINLFLTALLKTAGIDAVPVILSTRDHGKIKYDYPFVSFFNYVIVLIRNENLAFLADGSDPFTQYNRIPPKCINEKGLIINKEPESWISLDLKDNSTDNKSFNISVDPESLTIQAKVVIQSLEYDSYLYKRNFSNDTMKLKEFMVLKGINQVHKIITLNYNETERPYIISVEGIFEAERINNKIIISPFLKFSPQINELTQLNRNYPVDFTYFKSEVFSANLQIPPGFRMLSLPESTNIENEIADIRLEYTEENGLVSISGFYRLKKAIYAPAEYSKLRSTLNTIIKSFNEPLILEKI